MEPTVIPKLAELLTDPTKAACQPPDTIPAIFGQLEHLKAALWLRLNVLQTGITGATSVERLLDVREAAAKLHTSTDYIYRHASKLPFTVRVGHKVLFSEAGIERYISQRMGR